MTTNHDGLVSSAKLAALFGVARMTLSRLATAGVIVREGHGKYRLVPSIRSYLGKLREDADKVLLKAERVNALRSAQTRLAKEQADCWALKNAALRAELAPQLAVDVTWAQMCRDIRAGLRSLTARVALKLPHLTQEGIQALSTEIEAVLATLGPEKVDPAD